MHTQDSSTPSTRTTRPRAGRRAALLAALGALAGAVTLGAAAVAVAAQEGSAPVAAAPAASQVQGMEPFEATGLPAGRVIGVPVKRTFPPGFSLKHVHGGPTYVYVLSGTLNITDASGKTATYKGGDFFWEPAGYIHTAQTAEGAEVFILFLLPPAADAIITVP